VPTPCVNGQEFPLHPATSISSLEPATSTLGEWASTAMVGSFCLFCGNGAAGLPTLIRVSSGAALAIVDAATRAPTINPTGIAEIRRIKTSSPHYILEIEDPHFAPECARSRF